MINPLFTCNINNKPIYIYGTGLKGCHIYFELEKMKVHVAGFIDRDDSPKIGTIFGGNRVFTAADIRKDAAIIIASSFYEEIVQRLTLAGFTDLYIDYSYFNEIKAENELLKSYKNYTFNPDTLYVLCPYGLGDTLYVCSFLKDYAKKNNQNKICVIVKPSHEFIPRSFSYINDVIADSELVNQLNIWAIETSSWELKNFLYGHFRKTHDMMFIRPETATLDGMISQYRREVMRLSERSKPAIDEFIIRDKPSDYNLTDKDIVLIPHANSFKLLEMSFWENLAEELISMGYNLYTNVKDDSELPVKSTKKITGDISSLISSVKNCKKIIALRSGLSDILAFCNIPQTVIYTDKTAFNEWDLKFISNDINVDSIYIFDDSDISIATKKIIESI